MGPCEPLTPFLMCPAAKDSLTGLVWVTGIFGGVTILTMMVVVLGSVRAIDWILKTKLEKYAHGLVGGTICIFGV